MSTSCNRFETVTSRRELLHKSASGFGLLALQGLLHANAVAAPPKNINPLAPKAPHFKPKAKRVIFVFMHGGPSQVDTFDPKALGDNKSTVKKRGSLYPSIETSASGVRLCEHLPRTAKLMEHVTAVRSVNHKVIDEHAFATNLVHTGRMISADLNTDPFSFSR